MNRNIVTEIILLCNHKPFRRNI